MNAAQLSLIPGITIPALLLAGCATSVPVGDGGFGVPLAVPDTAVAQEYDVASPQVTLGVSDIEYGKINFADSIDSFDVSGVETKRTRVLFRQGTEAFGYSAGFSLSELGDFDMLGFVAGVNGISRLDEAPGTSAIVDYDASISLDYGDAYFELFDFFGRLIDFGDADLLTTEMSARIGGGVDFDGIQVTAGLASSVMFGTMTLNYVASGFSETVDVDGSNLGVYGRAAYAVAGSPLFVEMIGFGGDLSGVTINGGVRF